jgi:hypothetical protein
MTKRKGAALERFRRIALGLPGVEEGTSYGTPGFKVKGKFMARLRPDDPDVLVLTKVEEDEQRFLMETQPDVFFTTDHYRGYPTLLIRLSRVDEEQLSELVEQSWRRLAPARLIDGRDGGRAPIAGKRRRR